MKEPTYLDPVRSPEERARDLLGRMSLQEKIAQLGSCWSFELLTSYAFSAEKAARHLGRGIGQITRLGGATNLAPERCARLANQIQKYLVENTRLGVPAMIHEEICSGLMSWGATVFPQAIGVAATWDPELTRRMAAVIRKQMRALGAHQGLAPLLDVCRDPRWGRTEETFGEDPYVVASHGCAYIRGIQGGDRPDGVLATGKHFVGYGGAEGGMNWAPAKIPPRELREVFLAPFEAAVRHARLGSVMNSYGEIDGVPCAASRELLRTILREEWGFDGIVVSDYWAVPMLADYHRVAASREEAAALGLVAGIDVDLPSTSCYGEELERAIANRRLDAGEVGRAALAVLTAKFRLGIFEHPYVDEGSVVAAFGQPADRELARAVAAESIVLLKNDGVLPLGRDVRSVALIGPNADSWRNLIGDYAYPCHIETLVAMTEENVFGMPAPENPGDIAASVSVPTIKAALEGALPGGTRLRYAKGCDVLGEGREGFAQAVEAAKASDVAIVVLGDRAGLTKDCTSGESRDVSSLELPGAQAELLEAVLGSGRPVVLVLVSGRPYAIEPFVDRLAAILCAWLPGEAGAAAVADVLTGATSPSGKLPISVPRSAGQVPVYHYTTPSGGRSHWTGSYVDSPASPRYPFGHGLSYTTFEYGGLAVTEGPEERATVSCTVRNGGSRKGAEVVQLDLGYQPEGTVVTRPVKQLRGFARLELEAGQRSTTRFAVDLRALAFHDLDMTLRLYPGNVKVMVGSSSADIRLQGDLRIRTEPVAVDAAKREYFAKVSVVRG